MSSNPVVGAHGRDVTTAEAAQLAAPTAAPGGPVSFRDVLDALNPLQYLPVIGTIYRVATGDDGSPTLRTAISLVSGVLMGGPIGLLTSMAGEVFGHYFDFEHYARTALVTGSTSVPVAAKAAPAATATATPAPQTAALPTAVLPTAALQTATLQTAPLLTAATPQLATQAAAAYARFADVQTRTIAGGAER